MQQHHGGESMVNFMCNLAGQRDDQTAGKTLFLGEYVRELLEEISI